MVRLFFAVPVPEEVAAALAQFQQELREEAGDEGIRWVPPEQFHYTLKFLGETHEEQVPLVLGAARHVAAQCRSFTLALGEIGAFPAQRRPQIFWIGAQKEVPVLIHLAEYLDKRLSEYGFEPETRRFNPHLTLARIKSPVGSESIAKTLFTHQTRRNSVDKWNAFVVKSFDLMRSELRPTGPEYTVWETFTLSALPSV